MPAPCLHLASATFALQSAVQHDIAADSQSRLCDSFFERVQPLAVWSRCLTNPKPVNISLTGQHWRMSQFLRPHVLLHPRPTLLPLMSVELRQLYRGNEVNNGGVASHGNYSRDNRDSHNVNQVFCCSHGGTSTSKRAFFLCLFLSVTIVIVVPVAVYVSKQNARLNRVVSR